MDHPLPSSTSAPRSDSPEPKDIETSAGGDAQKLLSINNSHRSQDCVCTCVFIESRRFNSGRFVFCERSLSPLFQFIFFCSDLFPARSSWPHQFPVRRCKGLIAVSDCVSLPYKIEILRHLRFFFPLFRDAVASWKSQLRF